MTSSQFYSDTSKLPHIFVVGKRSILTLSQSVNERPNRLSLDDIVGSFENLVYRSLKNLMGTDYINLTFNWYFNRRRIIIERQSTSFYLIPFLNFSVVKTWELCCVSKQTSWGNLEYCQVWRFEKLVDWEREFFLSTTKMWDNLDCLSETHLWSEPVVVLDRKVWVFGLQFQLWFGERHPQPQMTMTI